MLVWKVDIHEGGHRLDGTGLLSVFDKVALAGLVLWVPLEALDCRLV